MRSGYKVFLLLVTAVLSTSYDGMRAATVEGFTKAKLKPCNERPLWKASPDASTGAVHGSCPSGVTLCIRK